MLMAACSSSRMLAVAFAKHLLRRRSFTASFGTAGSRRSTHGTSDANRPGTAATVPDEVIDVKSTVVTVLPDEVNQTKSGVVTVVPDAAAHARSSEYWTPDPDTGVFLPADELDSDVPRATAQSSVLDQTVWIRQPEAEVVDKPSPEISDLSKP